MSIASTYPVNFAYNHGTNVGTINSTFFTSDGFFYNLNPLLSSAKDVSISQSSLNILTNNLVLSECLSGLTQADGTAYVTSSVLSIGSAYLSAGSIAGSKIAVTTDITKATLFNLEFNTTNNTVGISFNGNYIAYTGTSGGVLNMVVSQSDIANETFFYSLYGDQFVLFVRTGSLATYVVANASNTFLTAITFTGFNANTNVITIARFQEPLYKALGEIGNVKYVKDPSSIAVATATKDLPFNFLLTAPYQSTNTTTNQLGYNITPLKNYYSPEHIQTPTLSAQSRTYNKIYTGLNTDTGFDKLYLSYEGNEVVESFAKDTDTYFHYPVSATNVALSASTLVASGAQPGSSPWRSDRIFVKQANYRKYTPWGSFNGVQKGTLFCSWLSASDIGADPVWMDRYYDSNYPYTNVGVLQTPGTTTPSNNNAPNVVWDVPTTQVFNPECLYIYHKIGDNDNMLVVDTLSSTLTHYVSAWSNPLLDGATGVVTGSVNNFTLSSSVVNYPRTRDPALNTSESYATLSLDNNDLYTPGFTLAFQLYNNNWQNIQGDQIIGNFYNGGIGLFKNNPLLTPFVTVIGDTVQTYNTNLKSLYATTYAPTKGYVLKSSYNESYFIVDEYFTVNEYDQDGTKISQFNLQDILKIQGTSIQGTFFDAKLIFENSIRKILIVTSYSGGLNWYKFGTDGTYPAPGSTGNGSNAGTRNYALDLNNGFHFYSDKGNGTVDSNNIVFALSGDKLVRGLNTSHPQFILSAYSAEYIACDHENNIWLLYGNNSLAKLDNYGRVLWDVTLTSAPVVDATQPRIINFTAELDPNTNALSYYGLVYDGQTQNVFKFKPTTGALVASLSAGGSASILNPAGDCTGYDYQRKYVYFPGYNQNLLIVKALVNNVADLSLNSIIYEVGCDGSKLTPGWHHFAITVDPYNNLNLYVDGALTDNISIGSSSTGIYRVYNQRNNPDLVIGTSSFKTQTLSQFTQNTIDPYSYNGYIADVRFYSQALKRADIVALQKRFITNSFGDLTWAAPAGPRYYIEQVDRFFLHRMPGAKSHMFNIKIKNSTITDPNIRSLIEQNIKASLSKTTPVYTQLNQIIWQ